MSVSVSGRYTPLKSGQKGEIQRRWEITTMRKKLVAVKEKQIKVME